MTYTHHFILQSELHINILVKDKLASLPHKEILSSDVNDVEEHWSEQNDTQMICVNVYVTEDV